MVQSHSSLRDDYEVSCAELDFLAEEAMKVRAFTGADDRRRVRRVHRGAGAAAGGGGAHGASGRAYGEVQHRPRRVRDDGDGRGERGGIGIRMSERIYAYDACMISCPSKLGAPLRQHWIKG